MIRSEYKTAIALLFLNCFIHTVSVIAQEAPSYGKRVYIKSLPLKIQGDSAWISMDIEIGKLSIGSERQLVLTPLLQADDQNRALPPVIINGKRRHKIYSRSLHYAHNTDGPYAVVKMDKHHVSQTIRYSVGIQIEPWMEAASLVLEQDLCGCGRDQQHISVEMVARQIFNPVPEANNSYAEADTEEPSEATIWERRGFTQAYVSFRSGESVVDPAFNENDNELDKIIRSITELKNKSAGQITRIRISAHASPEGSYHVNRRLSHLRAAALSTWLKENQGLKDIRIDSWGEGEDWVMLLELIRIDTVLSTADKRFLEWAIANIDDQDARERQILKHKGGETYRYLLHHLYPRLRRCDYRIDYTTTE